MSVYVFVGPTVSRSEVEKVLPEAICLPPAARGDIYRIGLRRPRVLAIIDGYFERVPSVWHKEILWAMASSIHVFGSSSMGALRAAELRAFGMEGVGKIFELFDSGTLEDDDEVAIIHGPVDAEYRAFTDAMVDIRATLGAARQARIICADCHDALTTIAKRLHYRNRTYQEILRLASAAAHPHELDALRQWLSAGRISQKRDDAVELLATIARRLEEGLLPKVVDYQIANTEVWRQLTQSPGLTFEAQDGTTTATAVDIVLDELRLQAATYFATQPAGLMRFLSVFFAEQHGVRPDAVSLTAAAEQFRRARGLVDEASLQGWLDRQQVRGDDFIRLMRDEALIEWAEQASAPLLPSYLLDQIRVVGDYEALAARAAHKTDLLEQLGLSRPSLEDVDLTEAELMRWFVREKLGRDMDVSSKGYSTMVGFESQVDFLRALAGEYCYVEALRRGTPS